MPERDRQTDGQMDGQTELLYQYSASACVCADMRKASNSCKQNPRITSLCCMSEVTYQEWRGVRQCWCSTAPRLWRHFRHAGHAPCHVTCRRHRPSETRTRESLNSAVETNQTRQNVDTRTIWPPASLTTNSFPL